MPAEIYDPLAAAAHRNGETPEALAVELLAKMTRELEQDPLEKHIGAYPSAVPDWADHHDKHLAQLAMDCHDDEK